MGERGSLPLRLYADGEQTPDFTAAICGQDGRGELQCMRFAVTRIDELGARGVRRFLDPDRLNTPDGACDSGSRVPFPGLCGALAMTSERCALPAAVDISRRNPTRHIRLRSLTKCKIAVNTTRHILSLNPQEVELIEIGAICKQPALDQGELDEMGGRRISIE